MFNMYYVGHNIQLKNYALNLKLRENIQISDKLG